MQDSKKAALVLIGKGLLTIVVLTVAVYGIYVALAWFQVPNQLAALMSMAMVTATSFAWLSQRLNSYAMAMTFFAIFLMTQWVWELIPLGEKPSAGGMVAGLFIGIVSRIAFTFYQVWKEK